MCTYKRVIIFVKNYIEKRMEYTKHRLIIVKSLDAIINDMDCINKDTISNKLLITTLGSIISILKSLKNLEIFLKKDLRKFILLADMMLCCFRDYDTMYDSIRCGVLGTVFEEICDYK